MFTPLFTLNYTQNFKNSFHGRIHVLGYNPLRYFCEKKKSSCSSDPTLEDKEKTKCGRTCKTTAKTVALKLAVQPVPCAERAAGPGECLRPYTNPCPPYPPCHPGLVPVHPCRARPSRPPPAGPEVREELSHRVRGLLVATSALVGGFVIYVALTLPEDEEHEGRPRCVLRPQFVPKYPTYPDDIPAKTQYLIVGGGTAAFSAFRTLKNLDPGAKILIINEEPYNPYMRAPLSKDLLTSEDRELSRSLKFKTKNAPSFAGIAAEQSIFYEPEEFFTPIKEFMDAGDGISIAKGYKIERIDYGKKEAKVEGGLEIEYDKCLLATGAKSKFHSVFEYNTEDTLGKVTNFRTVYDYLEIEDVINCGAKTIAVIGGTVTACELASSLLKRGIDVIQIIEEEHLMADKLPQYLAKTLTKKMEKDGVRVMKSTRIEDAIVVNKMLKLITKERKSLKVDHVIVALGTEANTELAEPSGLETDAANGGFLVNAELEVRSDHFAAGDCASFFHPLLGRRRLESYDHAVETGRIAAENMAGGKVAYSREPFLWSQVAPDLLLETVGVIDSKLQTVGVFLDKDVFHQKGKAVQVDPDDEYNKGLVFYINHNKIVGILTWNAQDRIELARKVLMENINYEQINDVSKLFSLHYN